MIHHLTEGSQCPKSRRHDSKTYQDTLMNIQIKNAECDIGARQILTPASLSGWAAEPLLEEEILQRTSARHRPSRLSCEKRRPNKHSRLSLHSPQVLLLHFARFCAKLSDCTTAAVLSFSGPEHANRFLMFSCKLSGRDHRNSFSACAGSGLPSWRGRAMPEAD